MMLLLLPNLVLAQPIERPSLQAGVGLAPSGQAVFDVGGGLTYRLPTNDSWALSAQLGALRDGVWEGASAREMPTCRPGSTYGFESDQRARLNLGVERGWSAGTLLFGYTGLGSSQRYVRCGEQAPGWSFEEDWRLRLTSGGHVGWVWRGEVWGGRAIGWTTWQGEQLTPTALRMVDGELRSYEDQLVQASSVSYGGDLLLRARLGPVEVLAQGALNQGQVRQRAWSSTDPFEFRWEAELISSAGQGLELAVPLMEDLLALRVWQRAMFWPGEVVPSFGGGLRWGDPLSSAPLLGRG